MESVRERILARIKTVLEGLTIANGYNFDFTSSTVQRWSMHGNSTTDLPMIIITPGDESEGPLANDHEKCSLEVFLGTFYTHNSSDSVATDTYISRLQGDIKKILLADGPLTGDGTLARSMDVTGSSPFESEEEQEYAGIVVELRIEYQHLRSDPTSAV